MLTRLRSFPYALVRESSVCMPFSYDTRSRFPPFLCASLTRPSVMQALAPSCWLNGHRNSEESESQDNLALVRVYDAAVPRVVTLGYDGPISCSPPQIAASATGCGISARSTSIGLICPVATRQFQGYCTISHV